MQETNTTPLNPSERYIQKGDDKEAMIRKFEAWYKESQTLHEARMKWIRKNENLYLGKHDAKDRPKSRSAVVHNKVFENIDMLESHMTEGIPAPVAATNSDDPVTLKAARTLENAIVYLHRIDNMQSKIESVVHNMLVHRDAHVMIRWDENIGEDGEITHEVADPENIRISPNATPYYQGEYMFNCPKRDYKYVVERYPEHKDKIRECFGYTDPSGKESDNKEKDKTTIRLKEVWYWQEEGTGKMADDSDDANESKDVSSEGESPKEDAGEFNIYRAVYIGEHLLQEPELNPNWDFEGELSDSLMAAKDAELAKIEQAALVPGENFDEQAMRDAVESKYESQRIYRNYLTQQEFPCIGFHTFVDENAPFSRTSLVEQIAELQLALNDAKRSVQENQRKMARNMWVIDSNSGVKRIRGIEGEMIVKNPGTEVIAVQGVPLPTQFFTDQKDSENAIDNIMGANSISKGELPAASTPVRTAIIAQQQDRGRVARLMRKLNTSLEQLYRWDLHMMSLFYTKERTIATFDELGSVESFDKIRNDRIPDGMQIYVKTGQEQALTQRKRAEIAEQLYLQGDLDPVTYFEQTGLFRDPYAVAERMDKWKKGILFQPPDIGPEQRAREDLQRILNDEKVRPDTTATYESLGIQAAALGNTADYPFTEKQIQALEEKMQIESEVITGREAQKAKEADMARIPADIAAQNPAEVQLKGAEADAQQQIIDAAGAVNAQPPEGQ